ncbi:MAG: hypothetical protein IT438_14155 [Phycisphaerales bacterium]|nr:hypothetical protein [Phycisphaerales bacterium]
MPINLLGQVGAPTWMHDSGVVVPVLLAGGVVLVFLIKTIGGVLRTNARERTRREIAAYIAEGSMTPEQGERLMKAGKDEA